MGGEEDVVIFLTWALFTHQVVLELRHTPPPRSTCRCLGRNIYNIGCLNIFILKWKCDWFTHKMSTAQNAGHYVADYLSISEIKIFLSRCQGSNDKRNLSILIKVVFHHICIMTETAILLTLLLKTQHFLWRHIYFLIEHKRDLDAPRHSFITEISQKT